MPALPAIAGSRTFQGPSVAGGSGIAFALENNCEGWPQNWTSDSANGRIGIIWQYGWIDSGGADIMVQLAIDGGYVDGYTIPGALAALAGYGTDTHIAMVGDLFPGTHTVSVTRSYDGGATWNDIAAMIFFLDIAVFFTTPCG